MSYKKIIDLAKIFRIKLAQNDKTNPGAKNSKEYESPGFVENIQELPIEIKNKMKAIEEYESTNPGPNLPPVAVNKEERITSPGIKPVPEQRAVAEILYNHAKAIQQGLELDYLILKNSDYFNNRVQEKNAINEIITKFTKLTPLSYTSPYSFITQVTDMLYSKPSTILHNKVYDYDSTTILDNINTIYFESRSELIDRSQELGLTGGKAIKMSKLSGLPLLREFKLWVEENIS